jgi:hypothetical protein
VVGYDGGLVGDGLSIEIIWFDQHVVEVFVACSNGHFSGGAAMYIGHEELGELAEALKGFPAQTSDALSIELGTFIPNTAGGGFQVHFSCIDGAGHVHAQVRLQGELGDTTGSGESVSLLLPVEAHGIDSFVHELTGIMNKPLMRAHLPVAGRNSA